jgi:hypothetical protein
MRRWKEAAAVELERQHGVKAGERIWRRLYIKTSHRRRLRIRRQCPLTTLARRPIG